MGKAFKKNKHRRYYVARPELFFLLQMLDDYQIQLKVRSLKCRTSKKGRVMLHTRFTHLVYIRL